MGRPILFSLKTRWWLQVSACALRGQEGGKHLLACGAHAGSVPVRRGGDGSVRRGPETPDAGDGPPRGDHRRCRGFFAGQGFKASSRELCKRLGISNALLFKYFANRDALLAAVCRRHFLR
ncbi:TetR/AcrR family transcriptional regulator [Paracoccus pacificus]|uniref:TetR/AcrR family transcriptional regulator n=1 Tax=Paracoccus pacificus TaxID=1463598 RepID=A0ABW4R8J7_9RHOB